MDELLRAIAYQTILLERIAVALEGNGMVPNYQIGLDSFLSFDWDTIGATIEQVDTDGVAAVTWRGNRYTRRSATNKFEPAIWFSRATGKKDEAGNPKYDRLITFKRLAEAEPLPVKLSKGVRHDAN
jgi:hypothetical protein